jgi:EmrB/QacA subfamily drug resistance transporter
MDDTHASTPRSGAQSSIVPMIVACALFMENLDSTIISTALPAIARSLHEDPLHLSLAITSYLLSLSIFIPLSGWIADRYGARRVFRNAILIFVLGSIGCAATNSIAGLVAARILQGLGGAMMVPVGRLVLLREIPKQELVSAMSYLTIPALIAPIFGPPLGGLIVTFASWHWIFLINVPIGVLGWYLVSRYVRDIRESAQPPLDLVGWWLLGGGMAGLVFGFENIGKNVLPAKITALALSIGLLLVALYVRHARTERWPIIRLSLLRIPTFRISVTGGSLFRLGVGGFTLLMPMMLQLGFHLTPLRSGLITFASAVGALTMKMIAPRITEYLGFRPILVYNTVLCATVLALCGWLSPRLPWLVMIGFLLVSGFFRSLQFTCLNALAFADVDEDDMSHATSFSSTAQQLALSVGVGLSSQALNLSLALRHGARLETRDFTAAFGVIAFLSLTSLLSFLRLAPDAGSAVSGHRLALANQPTTTAAD